MNHPPISRTLCTAVFIAFIASLKIIAQAPITAPTTNGGTTQAATKDVAFSRHSTFVSSVAFSPDGKCVASAGGDRIKITDLSSGKEILRLKNSPRMRFSSVAYSPDGRWLAGGQGYLKDLKIIHQENALITKYIYRGEVLVWDAKTGNLSAILNFQNAPAWELAFSPDGRWLAVGTGPIPATKMDDTEAVRKGLGEVMLWDTNTWKLVTRLQGDGLPIRVLAFSPDSRFIAGASGMIESAMALKTKDRFEIFLWDIAAGRLTQTLPSHTRPVTSIAFSANNHLLVSVSADRTMKIWDAQTYQLLQATSDLMISSEELRAVSAANLKNEMISQNGWLNAVVISPDGERIIGGGKDGIIRIYRTDSGKLSQMLKPNNWPIVGWDDLVNTTSQPSLLRLKIRHWPICNGALNSLALSPDGKNLVMGNSDGKIRLINLEKAVLH